MNGALRTLIYDFAANNAVLSSLLRECLSGCLSSGNVKYHKNTSTKPHKGCNIITFAKANNRKSEMQNRVREIDYLKCVFIVLMIIFHLVYVGDKYPYAKQVVYTFHMPAFLVISGYLANMNKGFGKLANQVKWLFVPYAVMEAGYTWMASLLPIREHIDELTVAVFIDKMLLHPLGPYWYLHTLIVCYLIYYVTSRLRPRVGTAGVACLMGVAFYAADGLLGIVSLHNAMYFMAGAMVRMCGLQFMRAFSPTLLAAVPLALFCIASPEGLDRSTLQGFVMTWLAMSLALAAYPLFGKKVKTATHFVGENTLAILLFSPIFTIITKRFVPLFAFDPTALLYTAVSVAFTIAGSLAVAWVTDWMQLSRWFSGKRLFNKPQ